jgi:HEXXH motif-containing protein
MSAPRTSLGSVPVGSARFVVELLPTTGSSAFDELPLAERPAPQTTNRLQTAVDTIRTVDDLATTVGCLVRACHVLSAEAGYDVSHSTPALPFSIFVSMPEDGERDAVLRLAESIIHEAMHLQLTLVESIVPLVRFTDASAFSPWKQGARPVQGLLHGLYVFAVIHEVLDALAGADPRASDFANRRRAEITDEVSAIGDARDGLTPIGVEVWDRLIASVGAR